MKLSLGLLAIVVAIPLGACLGASSDSTNQNDDELRGSVQMAKACAIQEAYAAAELADFVHVTVTEAPPAIQQHLAGVDVALAHFDVAGVGTVWLLDANGNTSFYDGAGILLAVRHGENGTRWTLPDQRAVTCQSSSTGDGGVAPVGDGGVAPGDAAADDCDRDRDGYLAARCGGRDCNDNDPTTHPNGNWTTASIDSDCDGEITPQYYSKLDCDLFTDGPTCAAVAGFLDAPPCGGEGMFARCTWEGTGCTTVNTGTVRVQMCR